MRYKLQSRLQDEGWKETQIEHDTLDRALDEAIKLDGFFWGMIRVVDKNTNTVIIELPGVSPKDKEKYRQSVPVEKVNYPKGEGMVRKEFIFTMLGAPILSLEIEDPQYAEICNRVKRVLEAYKKRYQLTFPQEMWDFLEEEGVLAHVSYVIARIRAKYERMPGIAADWTMDGREMTVESWEHIKWWHDLVRRMLGV